MSSVYTNYMNVVSYCKYLAYKFCRIPCSIKSPNWWIKIVMACLRTILKDESHTVGSSPLHCSSAMLNPTYLPTMQHLPIPKILVKVERHSRILNDFYQKKNNINLCQGANKYEDLGNYVPMDVFILK